MGCMVVRHASDGGYRVTRWYSGLNANWSWTKCQNEPSEKSKEYTNMSEIVCDAYDGFR